MATSKQTTQGAPRSVLVTGAAGYVGTRVIHALAAHPEGIDRVVASDVREPPAADRLPGVTYTTLDIRDADAVDAVVRDHGVDAVVHLAAIVNPPKEGGRALAHAVDVEGTGHVLNACVAHGVGQIIVTSSGAAYGYHADNPAWLTEDAPIRGNQVFAYAWHKRLVEEMLAAFRVQHPELRQLIFRPGTILGAQAHNQITAMFERPVVVGLKGCNTPFNFVWDEDVAGAIVAGLQQQAAGIFNLAGDGTMTLKEIARKLNKPYLALPVSAVKGVLSLLDRLGVSPYGPEQTMFLQYRPVLCNTRLKQDLGVRPRTTRQVFEVYRRAHA